MLRRWGSASRSGALERDSICADYIGRLIYSASGDRPKAGKPAERIVLCCASEADSRSGSKKGG